MIEETWEDIGGLEEWQTLYKLGCERYLDEDEALNTANQQVAPLLGPDWAPEGDNGQQQHDDDSLQRENQDVNDDDSDFNDDWGSDSGDDDEDFGGAPTNAPTHAPTPTTEPTPAPAAPTPPAPVPDEPQQRATAPAAPADPPRPYNLRPATSRRRPD